MAADTLSYQERILPDIMWPPASINSHTSTVFTTTALINTPIHLEYLLVSNNSTQEYFSQEATEQHGTRIKEVERTAEPAKLHATPPGEAKLIF